MPPRKDGTNYFARYFFNWWLPAGETQAALAEVDATTGELKCLLIDGSANTNIWRQPPKIDIPTGAELPRHE